ncbi:MAG TPA: hypothetical protein VHP33_20755 [Polyangiaceae bacterium]|nr:hypothetical protein [Polyangiaceae bacterium]
MFTHRFTSIAPASVFVLLAAVGPAHAAAPDAKPEIPGAPSEGPSQSSFHADVELDPTAYALDGFSLHAGLGWSKLRVDLGVFGLRVPQFVHQQRDFDVAFDGYGFKVQYFPFAQQRGGFVGVDGGVSRSHVHLKGTQLTARDNQVSLGVNAGWRFELIGGIYATPWLGVGYALGQDDVTLAGKTFAGSSLIVFPAVHLGYHLR